MLAVKLDGPTKEDYVWGFRVGFISFAFAGATAAQLKAFENKAAGAVRATISNAPSISQAILLKNYGTAEYKQQKKQKYDILKARYDLIRSLLNANPQWSASFVPMPFNSGYFMCVKPVGVDAENVRKELLANYSTGVIVLSGVVRLAFSAVSQQQIEPMFTNLDAAIRKLRG